MSDTSVSRQCDDASFRVRSGGSAPRSMAAGVAAVHKRQDTLNAKLTGLLARLPLESVLLLPDRVLRQPPDQIIKRGKVVIAVDTTVPHYSMLDANNQPTGIDIEVANLIGKNLKVPVEFVTVNSPGRIP